MASAAARRPPFRSGQTIRSYSTPSHLLPARRVGSDMVSTRALKIGISCYPTVGGSGILASALGDELAKRGHDVHFISYERPFRIPAHAPHLHFHPVQINDYGLFKYPDY